MPAYDPKKVSFTWGSVTATQYGKDSLVTAALNEDQFTFTPSVTGKGARNMNANQSGKFTVTLLGSSPTNDAFMQQYVIDRATGANAQPALLKDLFTPLAYASAQSAWCVKPPDLARAKEVGEAVWIFETDEMILNDGGAPAGQAV